MIVNLDDEQFYARPQSWLRRLSAAFCEEDNRASQLEVAMKRREFISRASYGLGASWLGSKPLLGALNLQVLPRRFSASDTVTLGNTGIRTSRLAMGTGTVGGGHHSNQTALGMAGLSGLLLNGYDQGLRFFDAADSYVSHPYVAEALRHIPRDKVTVLTKTFSRDPKSARADLDRFRKELGTDYLDICLMHCVTEGDWTDRYRGVMDVLSEAKEKGIIRAHGCSCHSIEALRAAAKSPWVEVDLARINPIGSHGRSGLSSERVARNEGFRKSNRWNENPRPG
jgi:hypothetical protein